MAEPIKPAYFSPVVVASGANVIRAKLYASTAWTNITITAGTYYITSAGSSALLTQMGTNFTSALSATIVWGYNTALSPPKPRVYNSSSSGICIDWSSASTTFPEAIIGVTSATYSTWLTGVTSNNTISAANQAQYCWFASCPIANDSNQIKEADVQQSRALSGAVWTVLQSSNKTIEIVTHSNELAYKTFADSSYTNQDWLTFWATCNDGDNIRYVYDYTDQATYFDCVLDVESCKEAKPVRHSPGVNLYSWTVKLLGKV